MNPYLPEQNHRTGGKTWVGEVSKILLTGEVDIFKDYTNIFEKELIIQALKYTKGRKVEAAKLLGIGRNTITRKIKELEIKNVNQRIKKGSYKGAFLILRSFRIKS